ncbi:MAG TPA: prepilin-type N-terminal cleavage/methylation domain-containing protein [Sulfurimonas sp.]|nr:prepilin-type N-terminal cleavage/methylation domain-containing protein [Sulfurimonas sp.]
MKPLELGFTRASKYMKNEDLRLDYDEENTRSSFVPLCQILNRKAFTLIEVMVASILISLVGLALLQMHQNSTNMSYKMQSKFKYSDWVLMPVFETKLEKAKKNTNFDSIMKGFKVDKREIRKGLDKKVSISATLIERIDMADMASEIAEETGAIIPSFDGLRLEVYKQDISLEKETYSVYRVIKP